MYTSADIMLKKICRGYITASAAVAASGAVYELFSHGVYSYYMIYAFAPVLLLGALPAVILLCRGGFVPTKLGFELYNAGIATLTAGSFIKGVLDIYGTSNGLVAVYPVVGAILLIFGALGLFKQLTKA